MKTPKWNVTWALANFTNFLVLAFLLVFGFSFSAFAVTGKTTYQAKIVKPDGYPLEASNVNFRFTVLDTSGSCVLYVEDYAAVNMNQSGGLISFALGSGTRSFPASGTSQTFQRTFDNSVPAFSCQSPGIYNPVSTDTRKIVMQFNDGNGWQTLPAMTINAVPYAMYANSANEAKTLNGKADTAFVETATLAALNCNSSTHAITFNGVSFSCIPVSSGSVTSVTTSGTVLITGGTSAAPVISIVAATSSQDGYLTSLDYAEFKAKLSASSSQIVNTLGYAPVSGAAVASQISSSNLSGDVSGTISSNFIQTVGGKTAAQISTSVDATLAASSGAAVNTLVKRDASGNSTFANLSANTASLNYVDIYKPTTSFNIRLQAPTSLSANYTLNLPTTSGTTGQVLSTDGLGNLSWINAATGSVTSVSGTLNEITSSGGSTPTIGLANIGTAGTYYRVITDNKGRVTSGVTTLTLSDLPASVLSTTSNFAGDISGMIANITVNRIQGVSVTVTSLINNDILQYDGSKYVNRNIPTCSGSQYLTFNGTGFTCVADAGASGTITTLTVTGPLSSTGGQNPVLSIAQANSTTNGYLSSTDWNTFNNKQVATSSAIIATLGYTPADNAVSGTYLQKVNNLSDLTNAVTARTNLGLGTLAVGNNIDLGSASATGIIADARLINQTNVTSGTQYTKVTVDGKGRITSATQLSSSDVTTALGYTPANATSGVTSLNGLTAQTQNFLVGTSGTSFGISSSGSNHTFNIPLASTGSVTAGLLSNADYTNFSNKITSSAASIAQVLGYVPADNAVSGTYLLKANNLSDLTNAATARTNLGLGTLAVGNNIDLGSASATGTLAIARLPNFIGDAIIAAASNTITLSNSGVLAGTYTKVTVDGKGRVTSGTQLSSSDVTTALGYTPANATSGVTSLNGLTAQTQNFLVGTSGTSFGISSSGSNHTFNIPLASAGSVTAGLLSNADYTNFSNKITSSAASIAQVLGYVPADNAASGTYLQKASNLSDLTNAATARTNLGLGTLAVGNNIDLGSASATGTLAIARLPAFSGDATIAAASNTIILSNSGVAAGTYTKVTVDTKGRVTSGAQITSSDVTTALGYTPANSSSTVSSQWITSGTSINYMNGFVGIGTTGPLAKLQVAGNILIDGTTTDSPNIIFRDTTSSGTWNIDSYSGRLRFFTESNVDAGSGTERMTLTASGNVGIGTASPGAKLEVNDGANTSLQIIPSGGVAELRAINKSGGYYSARYDATQHIWSVAGTEKIRIDTTGNLGVGVAAPISKLQVAGVMVADQVIKQEWSQDIIKLSTLTFGGTFSTTGSIVDGNMTTYVDATSLTSSITIDLSNSASWAINGNSFYVTLAGYWSGDMAGGLWTLQKGDGTTWTTLATNLAAGVYYINNTIAYVNPPTTNKLRLIPTSLGGGGVARLSEISVWAGNVYGSENIAKGSAHFSGNVGIGTTSPSYTLDVSGTLRVTGQAYTNTGNGSFSILSDIRYKDVHGNFDRGLAEILNIDIIKFNYKKDNPLGSDSSREYVGVSAQNLQQSIPEAVEPRKVGEEEYLTINTSPVLWTLINAVKQLYKQMIDRFEGQDRQIASIVESKADKAEIEVLKQKAAEVDVLKAENAELKNKAKEIDALKSYLCSKDPAAPICK